MRKGLVMLFLATLLLLAGSPLKAAPVSVDSARTVAAHVLGVETTHLQNRSVLLNNNIYWCPIKTAKGQQHNRIALT